MALRDGIQSAETIARLAEAGAIRTDRPFAPDQIQPASLDLRLGPRAYRVRASFLPGPARTVRDRLEALALHEIDLGPGAVLETACVYIAELQESLALPPTSRPRPTPRARPAASTSSPASSPTAPASSTRPSPATTAPSTPRSRPAPSGPRRPGARLSQIRFRKGEARVSDRDLLRLHARDRLVTSAEPSIQDGVAVSVDLSGFGPDRLVGFRAKRHTGLVDVDRVAGYSAAEFWEPLLAEGSRSLILDPGQFYILASKEAVHVPPDYAAEMVPFDPLVGEFRVHYAGFFDPGFGHAEAGGAGARAVLEVRSRDVPFILEDGQIVGRLVYERMAERPRVLYGAGAGSNYQGQALKLSKHFRA
jgi:dCTP deaminase